MPDRPRAFRISPISSWISMATMIAIAPFLFALIPAAAAQTSSASTGTPVEGREWIVIVDIVILVSPTRLPARFDNKAMPYHVLSASDPANSSPNYSGDDFGWSRGDPGQHGMAGVMEKTSFYRTDETCPGSRVQRPVIRVSSSSCGEPHECVDLDLTCVHIFLLTESLG